MQGYRYECQYCDSQFVDPPFGAKCPNCAGPHVRLIERKPQEAVPLAFDSFHAPVTRNPLRQAKRWAYRTLGFRVTTAVVIVLVVAIIAWQATILFSHSGGNPTPPVEIKPVPTSKPFAEPTRAFPNIVFYSAMESETLLTQANVIHVAVLGGGYGSRYMKDYAVVLDNTWKKVYQVFGVTGMTPAETTLTVKLDLTTHVLNAKQGFVLSDRPGKIYLYDGELWEHDYSEQLLVPIAQAQTKLTVPIKPNPQLSLTLK